MTKSGMACAAVLTAAMVLGSPTPAQAAGGAGRSFEKPAAPVNSFMVMGAGSWIGPWEVTKGSVDLVNDGYWKAAHGMQSVDLSGSEAGGVTRRYKTVPGLRYRFSYALAGNFACGPNLKTGNVRVNGQVKQVFGYHYTNQTPTTMKYVRKSVAFRAKSWWTWVTINSTTPGFCGPVIDDADFRVALLH